MKPGNEQVQGLVNHIKQLKSSLRAKPLSGYKQGSDRSSVLETIPCAVKWESNGVAGDRKLVRRLMQCPWEEEIMN